MSRAFTFFGILSVMIVMSCQKDKIHPKAVATAFPSIADSTILVEFNGSGSKDNSTYTEGLLFSWDFESDGYWEFSSIRDPICTHKFLIPGFYKVCMRVEDNAGLFDYDTVNVEVKKANTLLGQLMDERDGQVYNTVFLKGKWWMAENLNYGRLIHSDLEQEDNQIVEKYYFKDDSASFSDLGGLYRWEEAINYLTNDRGICPGGWHLPDSEEWETLLDDIDPWYAWQYYGNDGMSHLNIHKGKYARREYDSIRWDDKLSFHWARDYKQLTFLREQAPYTFSYTDEWGSIGLEYIMVLYDGSDNLYLKSSNYASVRCVKDY